MSSMFYLLCFGPLCSRYFLIFVSCLPRDYDQKQSRCCCRNSSSFGYCGGKVDLRARLKSISIWMCECRVLFVMLRVNPCVVARHKRGEGKPSKQQSLVSGHLAGRFNKICTTRIQYVRFGSH